MKRLQLADGLVFPLDAVTRAGVITGQRGTGKTSTAVVEVEEAYAAGAPSVIIDPTDAWWGLRSSADGRAPGLSHVVFGGPHGHLPLREDAGAAMGRLVAEQRLASVFSLKHLRKGAQLRFVTEFLEELYHLNRDALLMVIDEAHRFAPQQLRDQERGGYGARCLGAVIDIASLGRVNGLGIRLVTQRLARLHTDAREASEIMIVHRLLGPNDRKAVDAWLRDAGQEDEAAELGRKLPKLKRGQALVYAPDLDILGEFQIRAKQTFDSSSTPEVGSARVEPKGVADIDLAAIEAQIGDTIERAKADDPKELRKQLAVAKRELAHRPTEKQVETITETVEVPVLADETLDRLAETVEDLAGVAGKLVAATNEISGALGKLKARPAVTAPGQPSRPVAPPSARRTAPPPAPVVADGDFQPTPAQARILNALAALEVIGVSQPTKTQLALFAQASPKSSGYSNNLGAMRTAGLIDYLTPGTASLTVAGRAIADATTAPSTADELQAYVRSLVGPARARIVDALIDVYPDMLAKEDLADRAGASATSSGYSNNLGSLRSLGLIDYPAPGHVTALPVLFLEAA